MQTREQWNLKRIKLTKHHNTLGLTTIFNLPWSSENYTIYIYKYLPHSHVDIDYRTKVVLNAPTTTTTARPSRREYYDYDYVEVSRIIESAWGHYFHKEWISIRSVWSSEITVLSEIKLENRIYLKTDFLVEGKDQTLLWGCMKY